MILTESQQQYRGTGIRALRRLKRAFRLSETQRHQFVCIIKPFRHTLHCLRCLPNTNITSHTAVVREIEQANCPCSSKMTWYIHDIRQSTHSILHQDAHRAQSLSNNCWAEPYTGLAISYRDAALVVEKGYIGGVTVCGDRCSNICWERSTLRCCYGWPGSALMWWIPPHTAKQVNEVVPSTLQKTSTEIRSSTAKI